MMFQKIKLWNENKVILGEDIIEKIFEESCSLPLIYPSMSLGTCYL